MTQPFSNYFSSPLVQAGITSAYQEKPCLNPNDPECPLTAPNKQSKQVTNSTWKTKITRNISEHQDRRHKMVVRNVCSAYPEGEDGCTLWSIHSIVKETLRDTLLCLIWFRNLGLMFVMFLYSCRILEQSSREVALVLLRSTCTGRKTWLLVEYKEIKRVTFKGKCILYIFSLWLWGSSM